MNETLSRIGFSIVFGCAAIILAITVVAIFIAATASIVWFTGIHPNLAGGLVTGMALFAIAAWLGWRLSATD